MNVGRKDFGNRVDRPAAIDGTRDSLNGRTNELDNVERFALAKTTERSCARRLLRSGKCDVAERGQRRTRRFSSSIAFE